MEKELFPAWSPLKVARHYGFPVHRHSGKGQTVAIISLGGPIDLNLLKDEFESLSIPMPKIREIKVEPPKLDSAQEKMGSGEVQMDIQVVGCLCPDAEITVYRGAIDAAGFAAAVQKAVDDGQSVISISWGSSETTLEECKAMEAALKAAHDKGITVCASSGDWGCSNQRNNTGVAGPAPDGKAHLEYPASSPYVLACGGTELVVQGQKHVEVVWNNVDRKSGAAGGGVSALFELPEWQAQAGISIPSANNAKTGRVVPDVAALAAGGDWMVFDDFRPEVTGGSSAVAPLWAAFVVLVNEARASAGKSRLGFVNPLLYRLAAKGGFFNDIEHGTNRPSPDYPGYDACKGYNACAGWGTPIGEKLHQALLEAE
jgi:kumamolisin